jgi:hypothetical protein
MVSLGEGEGRGGGGATAAPRMEKANDIPCEKHILV